MTVTVENKRRVGRPQGEARNNNIIADYMRERNLTVKQFHQIAQEFVVENCPKLFQFIPGETYIYKLRNGYHDISKANVTTVGIIAGLIGCTPNDLIANPFSITGKWDEDEEIENEN